MTVLNGVEIIRFCCRSKFLVNTDFPHNVLANTPIEKGDITRASIMQIKLSSASIYRLYVCVCANVETVTTKKYFARIFRKKIFSQFIQSKLIVYILHFIL